MPDVALLTDASADRAYVRLRVALRDAEATAHALGLPLTPLTSRTDEPTALWIAPDQWLLASSVDAAESLIGRIGLSLGDLLHHATDATDALQCFVLSGRNARGVLAMGSGVDFDTRAFAPGHCVRTRFAKVAVVVHCVAADRFELIFDRSFAHYLEEWLRRAIADAAA
jgi:heterotetrameric sarcosine oxidase gamma subunit